LGSIRTLKISGLILRHPAPQFSPRQSTIQISQFYQPWIFQETGLLDQFFLWYNYYTNIFPKKLTIPIFSGTLTAVRYREIIQQCLEQQQLHDDEIVFPTKRCPCTHHIRDLECATRILRSTSNQPKYNLPFKILLYVTRHVKSNFQSLSTKISVEILYHEILMTLSGKNYCS
jgi:hypothetical protein